MEAEESANESEAEIQVAREGERANSLDIEGNERNEDEDEGSEGNERNQEDAIEQVSVQNCPVCFEEVQERNLVKIPFCGHFLCPDCFSRYVSNAIEEGDVHSLRCPDVECEIILSDNFLTSFLSQRNEKVLADYLRVKEISDLRQDPDCRWCPRPGCGKGNIGNPKLSNEVVCVSCGYKYCFDCGQDFHPEETCDQFRSKALKSGKLDKRAEAWKKKKRTKPCPQCKHDIEKDVGCNHMKCANCQYQFCWLCMRKYTPNHYDADNWENGCPNQCFDFVEPFPERVKKGAKRAAAYTGLILGGIVCLALAIPVVIVVGPFYGCYRLHRS